MDKKFLEELIKQAKENKELTKDKEDFLPVLFVESKDKKDNLMIALAGLPGEAEAKHKAFKDIGKMVKERGAEVSSIAFVCDTYFVSQDKDAKTKLTTRPSQSKDRKEALLLSYQAVKGTEQVIMLPYKKNKKQITWLERTESKDAEQNLLNNFWLGYI